MDAIDRPLSRRIMREDGETERPEDDGFLADELLLAALLAALFLAALPAVKGVLDRAFAPPYNGTRLQAGFEEAARLLTQVVTPQGARETAEVLNRALTNGAIDAGNATPDGLPTVLATNTPAGNTNPVTAEGRIIIAAGTLLEGMPSVQQVHAGMVRAARYYTNNYFNTQVLPVVQARIEQLLAGTDPTQVPDLTDVRALLDARLANVPYWRLVANAGISRAYHYGFLRAAQAQGRTGYRLKAVLDSKTSKVCRYMNGRVFMIADATARTERAALAETVEGMKEETPWLNFATVENLTTAQLRDRGFMVPPFHGNCRTSMVWL